MHKQIPSIQIVLVLLGLSAWGIAGLMLGNSNDYDQIVRQEAWHGTVATSPAVAMAPNNKAGLGALGFAIAGGLCFLGAAVAELARTLARHSGFPAEQTAVADRPRA